MADLSWYWHRLRAMSPGEVALHVRKKRVRTAPTKSSQEKRLRVKKMRGRRKRERGSGEFD